MKKMASRIELDKKEFFFLVRVLVTTEDET